MKQKWEWHDCQAKLKEYKETTDAYLKYYRLKRSMEFLEQSDIATAWEKIMREKHRRAFRKIAFSFMKVASVMLVLVSVVYFTVNYEGKEKKSRSLGEDVRVECRFPETGGRKAVLKLDNGQEIDLTIQEGSIRTSDNTVAVSKPGKSLSYAKDGAAKDGKSAQKEVHYNTLQVPRGGEYQLVLEDGTKVWLNAESSLRYPTDFSCGREVSLAGEAYFEVVKNDKLPFIVRMGENRIEVLGTKFNVSAYPENNLCATLVEGSVKISSAFSSVTLLPDEQAMISPSGHIGTRTVDTSLFTAWTQGRYEFRQTELEDIAEQLSRWYNVNIHFRDESLKHRRFAGVIFRNDELGFATEVIEKVSDVKFVRENDGIYITQY